MTNLATAKLKYLGGGFLPGVPARDLTRDEAVELGLDISMLLGSGLYELEEPPKPKRIYPKKEDDEVKDARWN